MKLALSLTLCAFLACAVVYGSVIAPVRFVPGQTYLYEYSGRLLTGIPQLADQYSGFEITSNLILQPLSDSVVALKLSNVRIGKHNGPLYNGFQEDIVMNHLPDPQYQKELTKPIRFVYNNGKITSFEADLSEPEWSINIKKSLLSLFNVNLTPKKIIRSANGNLVPKIDSDLTYYPVYEEGIGGICETVYELSYIPDPTNPDPEPAFVLNVTKTKNYDNCLTEPTIVNDNFDIRGCPWVCRKEKSFSAVPGYFPTPSVVSDPYMSGCPCGKEPEESPVNSYNYVNYNISLAQPNPLIEEIYSEGKIVYTNYGSQFIVIVQQNVSLVQYGAVAIQIPTIPRPQRHNELAFRLPVSQKARLDIPYYQLFGEPNVAELTNIVPELLDSLASDIVAGDVSASKDSMPKAVQVVNALAVLPISALESLYEDIAQEGQSSKATPKKQVIRKLFLDALPLSGSNAAAIYIKTLIEQNQVTTFEAKELVEAVPQNLFIPDIETIDAYLELFQSAKVQQRRHLAASTGIAFGKMVKEACVKRQSTPGDIPDDNTVPHNKRNMPAQLVVQPSDPQYPSRVTIQQVLPQSPRISVVSSRMKRSAPWESVFTQDICDEADIQKYVQIIGRLFTQADTFYQKVTLIETLAHMGVPQVLPIFEPFISGRVSSQICPGYTVEHFSQTSEECDFVRQVIIYALSHVVDYYPKQVLPLVLPVYSDPTESYEVRIAAFTTLLFADPDDQILERIASQLYFENNKQVQSFVYSALKSIGNFSLPCYEKLSQYASAAYNFAPESEYGYQYSKMLAKDYYDEKRDFGLYSIAEWVSSNISQVPRSGYFSVGQSNGPFQDEFLQLGFQAKGVESLVERVLEPNGLISDMFESLNGKSKDRRVISKRNTNSVQEAMEALKSKLNLQFRSDDEPKATIFFKLFDRTSYYPLDKHYIHQLIDNAEDSLKDIASMLTQGANYHYVKLIMPSQLYKVVPSEIGLPVMVTHRHPIILSLKVDNAKMQFETTPRTIYPTGVNITAFVQPSVFYSSYSFVFAINPANKQTYGVHVEKTTQVTLPLEFSIGYVKPKNLLTWSIIPKLPQEIIYHKTESNTFIAKANIAASPDRNWLQDAEEIKTIAVPFQYDETFGQDLFGMGVHVQLNSENVWYDQNVYFSETAQTQGMIPALVEVFRNPGLQGRELHVQLEPDSDEPVYGYDFTLRYKWVADEDERDNTNDDDDSDESSASDESDSDESDESSASKSSESKSSESNSDESSKSSKSSKSSEQSDESGQPGQKKSVSQKMKKQIRSRFNKVLKKSNNQKQVGLREEENESSDESSNESGSKSSPNSGSKESSQSSSSESNSSEKKNPKSQSAQSSESDSSSSSESDESSSFEDSVFDYEDVMQLILGKQFKKKSIKRIAKELVSKTRSVWQWAYDYDDEDEAGQEDNIVPAIISHDVSLTAVARGPRPTYYAMNMLYVHTYDHRTIWIKSDGHIKSPVGVYVNIPTLFCSDTVIVYPTLPGEFYYDPTTMQTQKAKIQAQLGWGQQCQHSGGIIVSGVMETTEDQVITNRDLAVQGGASPLHVQDWFYQQCQIDRSEGQPLSYACERAIIEDSYFNQIILDVQYKNIPKEVRNITQKLDMAFKVAYYENLENNYIDVNNPDDQIRFVFQYSQRVPNIPLANIRIEKPEENTYFSKIYVPYVRPMSSLLPYREVYYNLFTNYENTDSCALMEDFVRTYDNVTFQLPDNQCQYLLSKDCTSSEKFAVYATQLDEKAKTKKVTVLVNGYEIKLTPPTQQNLLQVVINGDTQELTQKKPISLNNINIYLRMTVSDAVNPIAVIEVYNQDIEILYDGKNAKILLGSQYQGSTCGLCGDNNDESIEEFAGPDQCIYEDSDDFANSYALSGTHCEQIPIAQGFKRCPSIPAQEEAIREQSGIVRRKDVRISQSPAGVTKVVRTEISRQQGTAERQSQIQNQADIEELAIKQQKQIEQTQAKQGGQPLSAGQEAALIASTPQQQKIIQRMRTQYIERDDMICFTTKPVLTCIKGIAGETRQQEMSFHCLPKSSPFTQQLIIEAQKQVIKQLANKQVDIRQVVSVPVSCVAAIA